MQVSTNSCVTIQPCQRPVTSAWAFHFIVQRPLTENLSSKYSRRFSNRNSKIAVRRGSTCANCCLFTINHSLAGSSLWLKSEMIRASEFRADNRCPWWCVLCVKRNLLYSPVLLNSTEAQTPLMLRDISSSSSLADNGLARMAYRILILPIGLRYLVSATCI